MLWAEEEQKGVPVGKEALMQHSSLKLPSEMARAFCCTSDNKEEQNLHRTMWWAFRAGILFQLLGGSASTHVPHIRDGETTIKIKFELLRGGALGQSRESSRNCWFFFSWETPRQKRIGK